MGLSSKTDIDSTILNFTTEQALEMFDALSRTNSARQIKPLEQSNYITYKHREYYDEYNLIIGDVYIMVPPEFIYVSSESFSQSIQTIRQENSQKQKTGYHKRTIKIDLVFNGMDEINGYKVDAPLHYDGKIPTKFHYVDGLRTLLAQFKFTPFLPIRNSLLNDAYDIHVVALQSIVIETIDGFQNALMAHINLQEIDMMPYIEMGNRMFRFTIDWDLFRYYIQSFLTENHEYKNLQSLPVNKDHTAFKLKILKEDVLQTVSDKTDGTTREETLLDKVTKDENYECLIDSEESDVHITSFQCSYANMLTSIQMSDAYGPTLQYLGGLDTQFGITFETTDVAVVGAIEKCQIKNDLMVRNNPKVRGSIGFVKLETDLVMFCGSLFCTVESIETSTVTGIPGLYHVRMLCVSYDIAQSKRENLNGFLPFDGQESTVSDLDKSGDELEKKFAVNAKQAINQSLEGLQKKIYQDNYAEWKLRTSIEVYPDLRLPTYQELNEAITNINKFRAYNNLEQLPYKEYPIQPTNIMFGSGSHTPSYPNDWLDMGGSDYYANGALPTDDESREYNGFVDPDFYVFYPNTYMSIYQEEQGEANDEEQSTGYSSSSQTYSTPIVNKTVKKKIKKEYKPTYYEGEDTDSNITKFITILKQELGRSYCPKAEGEVYDYKGKQYDESGLITYGLKVMGILPENFQRLTCRSFGSLDIFKEVPISALRRGDIITNASLDDCCTCTGTDGSKSISIITAHENEGVCEMQLFFEPGHVYRILPLQENSKIQGTKQSKPYISDGNQHPDENGNIIPKKPRYLDTVQGYTSANPYGDDNEASRGYEDIIRVQVDVKNPISDLNISLETDYSGMGGLGMGGLGVGIGGMGGLNLDGFGSSMGSMAPTYTSAGSGGGSTINQDLGVWSPISESELNAYINQKAPANSPFRGQAGVFIQAANQSGLDPRYILAHAALESGWGTSNIARNKNNYFGIGAFDSSPYSSAYSFNSGLAAGIIGGAQWISKNYYNGKYNQTTLNSMRNNGGVHQYATDPNWANKIANIMDGMPSNTSSLYSGLTNVAGAMANATYNMATGNIMGGIGNIAYGAGAISGMIDPTGGMGSMLGMGMPQQYLNITGGYWDEYLQVSGGGDYNITNRERIKLNERYRRNQESMANELAEITKPLKLEQADISGLSLPPVEDDGSAQSDGSVEIEEHKSMTTDEFNALALAIATECAGETLACKMAMAQFLYDSAQKFYRGNGITTILKNDYFKEYKGQVESKDMQEAKQCVQRVFQDGVRWKKNCEVLAYTSMSNSNFAKINRSDKYDKLQTVNQHTYFGRNTREYCTTPTVGYNIGNYGVSKSSDNGVEEETEAKAIGIGIKDTKAFGKPIYIKPKHFDTHDEDVGQEWHDLNSNENRFNTSFVDDCQYSAKGRLVKAFPTFLFCILDDQAQWYDGRKLWTNYYVYKPVINIQYHAANDMPTETAQITVTNTYHNLDRSSAALINYSISEDEDYCSLNRKLYKNFGMIIGGVKITNRLIQMHSIIFDHTKLREGARIHLRMGYGSDPMSLAPIINGTVSGLTLGDQISITVTSDGHELIQSVTSDKSKDVNNGALGLFGLGARQEASNIIAEIMIKRESWMNHLFFAGEWFEGSKYNIEHFGLYINSGNQYALQGGIDTGIYEQYDLLMNIYKAATEDGWFNNYRHWGYMYQDTSFLPWRDGEGNIVFNQYNMTPWDVFQLCAQTMPEFLIKAERYQFDSRLYYGLPFDLTKYRYDVIGGTVYQECKANTQMHYLDSLTGIIENQVSVSSKRSFTNAKVIYTRGSTPKATAVIHSDDTIDHSKQSTRVIDSCIVQDYVGPDAVWEWTHISTQGKVAARRLGISNLLYGWQQQYQGQLLCLGQPQIRPDDYLMINDFYTSLNGLCMVREVIHSFGSNTGYTTSIIPGIIGFSPEQETNNVNMIVNYLKVYGQFTEFSQNRKLLKENCERYSEWLSLIDSSMNKLNDRGFFYGGNEIFNAHNLKMGTAAFKGVETAMLMYKVMRGIKNAGNILKYVKAVANTYKALKAATTVVKGTKTVVNAINLARSINLVAKGVEAAEAGIVAAGAASAPFTFGLGFAVALLISIILDAVMSALESWIENRNVCVLLPLWWEAKPFIAGVKDGEKILLIKDENNGSDENTEEDGRETDEDEMTVEDN